MRGLEQYLSVEIPLRLHSAANLREHWMAKAQRVKRERAVGFALAGRLPTFPPDVTTMRVVLTRIAPRKLDGDNLQSAFKAVRDAVADALRINDGDSRVTWDYAQERGRPKQYAVRVEVQA